MAKATQLEKALSRHTRHQPAGRQELVDSFKRLQSLIKRLSAHLSQQELEGILVDITGQQPQGGTPPLESGQKPVAED